MEIEINNNKKEIYKVFNYINKFCNNLTEIKAQINKKNINLCILDVSNNKLFNLDLKLNKTLNINKEVYVLLDFKKMFNFVKENQKENILKIKLDISQNFFIEHINKNVFNNDYDLFSKLYNKNNYIDLLDKYPINEFLKIIKDITLKSKDIKKHNSLYNILKLSLDKNFICFNEMVLKHYDFKEINLKDYNIKRDLFKEKLNLFDENVLYNNDKNIFTYINYDNLKHINLLKNVFFDLSVSFKDDAPLCLNFMNMNLNFKIVIAPCYIEE